jgi:hypothetical protein
MTTLAQYLDELINGFYATQNNYPGKILMPLASYNKLIEVCKEQDLSNSWFDFKNKNYKGIPIEIKEVEGITFGE